MCLAVPAKLVEVEGNTAVADLHGNRVPVSTVLINDVEVGDWVLVHAGFAIRQVAERDAVETWRIIESVQASPLPQEASP